MSHSACQQQQVIIDYSLYRGNTPVTVKDAVWLASSALQVEDLRAKVCQERKDLKLNADKTLVFGSKADLLECIKDRKAGEQKVADYLAYVRSCSLFEQTLKGNKPLQAETEYWLLAVEG